MSKIICDWMLCEHNSSMTLGKPGECKLDVIKLVTDNVIDDEGYEEERLSCNMFTKSNTPFEEYTKSE